jgi:hypothetical protein
VAVAAVVANATVVATTVAAAVRDTGRTRPAGLIIAPCGA